MLRKFHSRHSDTSVHGSQAPATSGQQSSGGSVNLANQGQGTLQPLEPSWTDYMGQISKKTGEPMTVVGAMTEESRAKVKSHLSQKDWNDPSKRTDEQMFEVAWDVDRLATWQFDSSDPDATSVRASRIRQLTQLCGRLNGDCGTKDGLGEDLAALTRDVLTTELKMALPESLPSTSSQGK